MDEKTRGALRRWIVDLARDIGIVIATVAALSGAVIWTVRPHVEPFVDLPDQVSELQRGLEGLRLQLLDNARPQIVDFKGAGVVADPHAVEHGGIVTLGYTLRRRASCDTIVHRYFVNLQTNRTFAGPSTRAVRAPVSDEFQFFLVPIDIPYDLPPGWYVYFPELEPLECGVYGRMRVPASMPFEVVQAPRGPN